MIKIRRGYKEGVKPTSPEQLRQRLKLLGHAYLFAQLKYPHKSMLQGLEPMHWAKYADYLLGEHVMGLEAKDERGEVVSKPTFELILSYEHQIRRNMTKLINNGKDMVAALQDSMTEVVVKERYFLTPNSASALFTARELHREDRSRSPNGGGRWGAQFWRNFNAEQHKKGKGKGKSKKGKGFQGKSESGLHHRTPDGRQICYAWNSAGQRCRYDCGRVHCCQRCLGKHPLHACPEENKGKTDSPKDTEGQGA